VTCRAAAGECDVAETCDGVSTSCPTNAFALGSQVCRGSGGSCDVAETCTGNSPTCPADGFLNAGTFCRAAAGTCDVAETCTGTSAACPADGFLNPGTFCRAAAGACDVAETCTGTSAACPEDTIVPADTICDTGTCGVCDGETTSCSPGEIPTTPFEFTAENGADWVVQEDDEIRITFEDSNDPGCDGTNSSIQSGTASKVECFAVPTCIRFAVTGLIEKQNEGFEPIEIRVDGALIYERASLGGDLECTEFESVSESAQVLVEPGTREILVSASTGTDGAYHKGAFWEVGIERLAASFCD
jgi:hypothetical protein